MKSPLFLVLHFEDKTSRRGARLAESEERATLDLGGPREVPQSCTLRIGRGPWGQLVCPLLAPWHGQNWVGRSVHPTWRRRPAGHAILWPQVSHLWITTQNLRAGVGRLFFFFNRNFY